MSILKTVQNYILPNENKPLSEYLAKKHQGFEQGWRIEKDIVIFYYSPTVKLSDNPLRSPAEYKWKVVGDKIIPINGRAINLTRELLD